MGGLAAVMLAHAHPDRVLSFIDIEGNVAPEDCFLSRQIADYPAEDADAFLGGFIERISRRAEYASRLYSMALPMKVRPTSVRPIFTSMIDLSDGTPLMDMMAGLPLPRLFVHGEQNRNLSNLEDLPGIGVEVAEIRFAGRFPMYSNPPSLWPPGIDTQIFVGEQAMLSIVNFEPHSEGSRHSHAEEQWGVLLEGSGVRIQDGVEDSVGEGDFWCTPSNIEHGFTAGPMGAKVLDIFAPPREAYRTAGTGFAT